MRSIHIESSIAITQAGVTSGSHKESLTEEKPAVSKHMKAAKPLMRYEELPPHSSETAVCGKNLISQIKEVECHFFP